MKVQPCSQIGCGSWSDELDATTSDGMADPPENIEMRCFHDNTQNINYVVVTWDSPKNVRGSVQAYNTDKLAGCADGTENTQNHVEVQGHKCRGCELWNRETEATTYQWDIIHFLKGCSAADIRNYDQKSSEGLTVTLQGILSVMKIPGTSRTYLVTTYIRVMRPSAEGTSVTLEGEARYRNASGQVVTDTFQEFNEVQKENKVFKSTVRPNTNYTVKICTVNKAGCGHLSTLTEKAKCVSPPSVPSSMPEFKLNAMEGHEKCRQLTLKLQKVSERNGFIRCYRVIVIKLAKGETISILPRNPHEVNLTSYEGVHQNGAGGGAYLAEAFDNLSNDSQHQLIWKDTELRIFDSGSLIRNSYCDEIILPHERQFRGSIGPDFISMDDNARPHKTFAVEELIERKKISAE
ncbi:uncharacterized protein TNCV_4059781 [Trichonephila clavipes]|nr:uncharacterized protein TNCV_4059781 [Trichonephila clavipes]